MAVYRDFTRIHRGIWHFLQRRSQDTFINRQRLLVYIYFIIIVDVFLFLQLFSMVGTDEAWPDATNISYYLFVQSLLVLFVTRLLSLKSTLYISFSTCALLNIFHMLSLTGHTDEVSLSFIIGHVVMLTVLLFLSQACYLKILPLAICLSTVVAFGACCIITNEESLTSIFGVIALFLLAITVMSNRINQLATHLCRKNKALIQEYTEIFSLLKMDKADLARLLELAKNKNISPEKVDELLKDFAGRHDIESQISQWNSSTLDLKKRITENWPMLSETQQEICFLILSGKKNNIIAQTLDKSLSNISSQRSKIRAKLNIPKETELETALWAHLNP